MMNTKRLLDVCDFQGGTQPPKDEWVNDPREGYVRMLQIRDYSQGDAKFVQYVKDTKRLHKCTKDDIMLSRYGYIGQAFIGLEGAYNVALVKVVKKEEMHTPYLFYYFQSYYFQHFLLSNVGARATIPGFNKDELENALIRIPEMCEQIEIASKIAKVDELIDLHKQQINILEILVKSRFIELFSGTFEIVSAEDVCSDIVDCPHSTPKYDEIELTYPAIRTSEIQNGSISWDSMKYVGVIEYEKRVKRLKPERGDVVYAREGTYGDCVILPDEYKFCLGQRTMLFRPNYKICTSAYLHAALRSDAVKKQADESNAGSTVPHVNVADAKKFHFPLPPLELQQQFAAFVEQVDKSKLAVQKGLQELEILKKSLMQQYFG